MGHFERPDVVKKRINFLRKIKEYRILGKHIVYWDEIWVDTNTYPAGQWVGEGFPQRNLPAGRGQRFVILHCGI